MTLELRCQIEEAIEEFITTGNDFDNCSRSCIRDMIIEVIEKEIIKISEDSDTVITIEETLHEISRIDLWIDRALVKHILTTQEKLNDIGISEQDFYRED